MMEPYNKYNAFARIYNDYWGPHYGRNALSILKATLGDLPERSCVILDLCCGSGHVSASLIENGYEVVGIDGSQPLLDYARKNAPLALFHHADGRDFHFQRQFDGAICLNDSLNHILTEQDLRSVFLNVFRVLRSGGWFLFDLNLERKYKAWQLSRIIAEEDLVCAIQADADLSKKLAFFRAIVFERCQNNTWKRQDTDLQQTWYSIEQIEELLTACGFINLHCLTKEGNQLDPQQADRAYFLSFKPREN